MSDDRDNRVLQRQAKALGDPTRHRLFRYVTSAPGPVTVAELTDYVMLNHNAVRRHLTALHDAGLIIEERECSGRRGRPRLLYRVAPETAGRWDTPSPYQYLASLLSEALRDGTMPRRAGLSAGRRAAGLVDLELKPLDAIEDYLARRGFRPSIEIRGAEVDLVFGNCPFDNVAAGHPDVICQLCLGVTEGLSEGLGEWKVVGLVPKDPYRAGCRLSLQQGRVDTGTR